jgi:hypothetical protein
VPFLSPEFDLGWALFMGQNPPRLLAGPFYSEGVTFAPMPGGYAIRDYANGR